MKTESDIERAFDRFHLYTKGNAIVNMIKELVSSTNFLKGVRRYSVFYLSGNEL